MYMCNHSNITLHQPYIIIVTTPANFTPPSTTAMVNHSSLSSSHRKRWAEECRITPVVRWSTTILTSGHKLAGACIPCDDHCRRLVFYQPAGLQAGR